MRALILNGGPGRCGDTVDALQRTFTQELTENGWDVDPIVLRGDCDDPRGRFWAERAGAFAFVAKGSVGELVRVLQRSSPRCLLTPRNLQEKESPCPTGKQPVCFRSSY